MHDIFVPLRLCAKSISPTSVRGAFVTVDMHGSATPTSGQRAIIDHRSPIGSGRQAGRIACTRNGGRHRCQPPLSGILPVAARLPHPGPLLLRSAARKTTLAARSGAIRRWFGRPPFGGRPHLESPSSSLPCVCRNSRCPSDGLHFLSRSGPPQLVGIAAFRDQGIGPLPRRSGPFFSGWSCNLPSCPGGPSSPSSDDWKLT